MNHEKQDEQINLIHTLKSTENHSNSYDKVKSRKSPLLIIIADDFTGALDTGVQFSKQDISTYVACDLTHISSRRIKGYDVLVVDTDSRHMSAADATESIKKVLSIAKEMGIIYIYKKTDSTLRGNIGCELDAVITYHCGQSVYFIPAYPEMNRTTLNGKQYIEGKLLSKSIFNSDILNPIKTSIIRDLLAEQTNMKIVNIKKDQLTNAVSFNDKNTIYVFDSETQEDMELIVEKITKTGVIPLIAGCAGFAKYVPSLIGLKACENSRDKIKAASDHLTEMKSPRIDSSGLKPNQMNSSVSSTSKKNEDLLHTKKTLIICGSVNQMSLEQTKMAIKNNISYITLKPKDILSKTIPSQLLKDAVFQLKQEYVLLLKTVESSDQIKDYLEYGKKRSIDYVSLKIAENIGRFVKKIMDEVEIDNMVVFGGDTLRGIIQALKVAGLKPEYEVFHGVPLSSITVGGRTMNLITKAGGYGDCMTLVELVNILQK